MSGQNENKDIPDQNNMNALIAKYQELQQAFRYIVSVYFKGSTITLAVYAGCFGYLFKVPLTELQPDSPAYLLSQSGCFGMRAAFGYYTSIAPSLKRSFL